MQKMIALVVAVLLGLPVATLAHSLPSATIGNEPVDVAALRFVDARHAALAGPLTSGAVRDVAGIRLVSREVVPQQTQGSQRSWMERNPVLFGALVGFGVGFAAGSGWCGSLDGNPDTPCWFVGLAWGGAGAGLGAGVGFVVSRVRR
jgi:hypothetical protein